MSQNFYGQALDSLGNRLAGENGVLMCSINDGFYQYGNVIADGNNGIILVFEKDYQYDIYAKRAYLDGTLGGPYPPIQGSVITISDTNLVLTWPAQMTNALYLIYKSNNPYSFLALPDTTITDTLFIDIGALNQFKRFYRITWEP
jgi:hypothetical protein